MAKPAGIQDAMKLTMPFGAPDWVNSPMGALAGAAAFFQACQQWQQELGRFFAGRIQEDSQYMQRLAACRDWDVAAKLYQEWATAVAQDVANRSTEMFALAAKIGTSLQPAAAKRPPTAAE